VAWAALALGLAALLAAWADGAFALLAVGLALALALHLAVEPDDPASVTRAELGVILLGIVAGLGTAAALAAPMGWALAAAAVLVPLELRLAGAAHAPLMARRAALAEAPAPPA
jgi:hypothetical protein